MSKFVPLESPLDHGAVRTDIVIRILKTMGVTVSEDDGKTTFAKGDVVETHTLGPIVHRRLVNRFARKFDIAISSFYLNAS